MKYIVSIMLLSIPMTAFCMDDQLLKQIVRDPKYSQDIAAAGLSANEIIQNKQQLDSLIEKKNPCDEDAIKMMSQFRKTYDEVYRLMLQDIKQDKLNIDLQEAEQKHTALMAINVDIGMPQDDKDTFDDALEALEKEIDNIMDKRLKQIKGQ